MLTASNNGFLLTNAACATQQNKSMEIRLLCYLLKKSALSSGFRVSGNQLQTSLQRIGANQLPNCPHQPGLEGAQQR